MARTTDEIYTELTNRYVSEMAAVGVTVDPSSWSQVNIQRLIFYVVSLVMVTLEQLYDQLKLEVNDTIAQMKPHSLRWYANKAKEFQYGYPLVDEADYYDNSSLTQAQIDASKIIKHSAVVEQEISTNRFGLRIKVATITGDDLAPLSAPQLSAFTEYMEIVKDAGVGLLITSGNPDDLKLNLKIYYDPLVLNNQGQRLDGTNPDPVQDAIKEHLKNLPFNGKFNLTAFVDKLQTVDGVEDPKLLSAQARYGALPYAEIIDEYTPDAGYLRVPDYDVDLTITWIPKVV